MTSDKLTPAPYSFLSLNKLNYSQPRFQSARSSRDADCKGEGSAYDEW